MKDNGTTLKPATQDFVMQDEPGEIAAISRKRM